MVRVGAVSYLNTKPLVLNLEKRLRAEFGEAGTLTFDLPSRLADSIDRGELDVALIPAIEYLRSCKLEMVSNAVIGCRGPVWSVRMLSRVPVRDIKSLAMDEGSRTSQALLRILLWEQYQLTPRLLPFPMAAAAESIRADALLMIGDRAMHPPKDVYREIWDLGDRWCRWTELPFVFAVWAGRTEWLHIDRRANTLAEILEASRDEGLQSIDHLASQYAGPLGLTETDCIDYLSNNLHFQFGSGERLGLERFRQAAMSLGLVEQTGESENTAASRLETI